MPTPFKAPSWSEKVLETFRNSPKKMSLLGALTVMLVIAWLRLFIGHHGPSAAQGAMPPSISPAAQGPDVRVLDDSEAPQTPRPGAVAAAPLQQWAHQPVGQMQRNIFAIPLDYYPRDGAHGGDDTRGATGFWDQLAKSMSAQADQQEQRQILIENVNIKAAALKLQTTMMGSQPTAMVNGEMVREGSVVAGFRVLSIEARRMIVEREGIKLEILMK
jgi:hypothetical protein